MIIRNVQRQNTLQISNEYKNQKNFLDQFRQILHKNQVDILKFVSVKFKDNDFTNIMQVIILNSQDCGHYDT